MDGVESSEGSVGVTNLEEAGVVDDKEVDRNR